MSTTHTLVIGAGQAGLAMSHSLADADIDHLVVERGRVGERWLGHRWQSLRLLTPNWATRLPGWSYEGHMTALELAGYLSDYATSFSAPVHEHSPVRSLERIDGGYVVCTDDACWRAANVVIATGWCDQPRVPAMASGLGRTVAQVTSTTYGSPDELPDGRVLVVGASATGVQIADELARSGRDVVLAVGRHSRLPRCYRGVDIWWWLDRIGTFARTVDQVSDPARSRVEGSVQLTGRADRRNVDLPALQALGVHLAGRLVAADGTHVQLADDLPVTTAAADARLERILRQVDDHIRASGLDAEVLDAGPLPRVDLPEPIEHLDLQQEGISTVVWATGFTRPYPWLKVPVLDERGEIIQRRGVTPQAGLYVLGQRFQHRGDSNFIDGVRHDARYVAHHIACRRRSRHPLAPCA
jgi:putative flavoprotein involved in K+ transport